MFCFVFLVGVVILNQEILYFSCLIISLGIKSKNALCSIMVVQKVFRLFFKGRGESARDPWGQGEL